MGWAFFGFIVLLFLAGIFVPILRKRRMKWRGAAPHQQPVQFLNRGMAVRPTVLGHNVPDGYRLASLYFGAGLIDRTGTLDHGFPYEVLDPIPEVTEADSGLRLKHLCDYRAASIVRRSKEEQLPLYLAWSGGIDSTAACVALLRATTGQHSPFSVYCSNDSIGEYPKFYKEHIKPTVRTHRIRSIRKALPYKDILVTGEHGDQLFGSTKAIELSFEELAAPWEDSFPRVLSTRLASTARADTLIRYLEPQVRKAPVPLPNLYEFLWWINFSMKWQSVSQRIPAAADDAKSFERAMAQTEHFFRTDDFQRWSMANPNSRIRMGNWASYKWPLKDYIKEFTADAAYHEDKEKHASLRGLNNRFRKGYAFAIDGSAAFLLQDRDDSLRYIGEGPTIIIEAGFEVELWDDMEGDGE